MTFTTERIDITDLPMVELERLDMDSIERIERADGKVVAVVVKRKVLE